MSLREMGRSTDAPPRPSVSSREEMPNAMMPMNLVRFSMLFVSGVFLSLEAMPVFLRPVAYLMPLTYSVDVMRQAVLGPLEPLMLLGDIAALDLHRAPTAPP